MSDTRYRNQVEKLVEGLDIRFDGARDWDIEVHNPHFFHRVLAQGSLGLGESYMDGWWDCRNLEELFFRLLCADLDDRVITFKDVVNLLRAKLRNLQKPSRAFQIGQYHYDMGNDLYRQMLGKRLVYSCGYWRTADNLDDAQEAKLELVCRKLGLQPGMRVLDIGCGWGEAAQYAATHYGVEVVGVTVSEQQAAYARELCGQLPVEIRLQDYRDIKESFDRVFSIGMFEHVGVKNYRTYMEVARGRLKDDGLFLLHTIGSNKSVSDTDPWIAKYIFPNSMLPSAEQICAAIEGLFVFEDWHNFGIDYNRTLRAWLANFESHWKDLEDHRDKRFYRMWRYYLQVSAAAFRSRKNQLWQIVLSPRGVPGGYVAPR